MIKERIREKLKEAISNAKREGAIPDVPIPEVSIEKPKPEFGDYASTVALRLSRSLKISPMTIAEKIVNFFPPMEEIERINISPPGFINFTLSPDWLRKTVDMILEEGEDFGRLDIGKGERVQVEFVSVNPTGPLHIGHGRGAVIGSVLSNILEEAGYKVVREYYINDAGTQIDLFALSVYARYMEALGREYGFPHEGYRGEYVKDIALEIKEEYGDEIANLPESEALERIKNIAVDKMLRSIREDLELIGVHFDVWFSEKSLFEKGVFEKVMGILREKGYVKEKENALWFSSDSLGEDKENVLIRRTGAPTYFASDIAYHYDKFIIRGFDRVINIWGADHQGHVNRIKAAIQAFGIDPSRLHIIIFQMVNLKKGEEFIKASKRAGELITLRELIDEVGRDVARFFYLLRTSDSQMEFDLELAKKESMDNPVYYIQYAYARICGILRHAEERGVLASGDISLLSSQPEIELIKKLIEFPEILDICVRSLEPHYLPFYLHELAVAFHNFYTRCRVISDDDELSRARLKLVLASKIVIGKALKILGVSAPERM